MSACRVRQVLVFKMGFMMGFKAKRPERGVFASALAERVGFEPTVPCSTPDFESGTIDHSATSPGSVFVEVQLYRFSRIFVRSPLNIFRKFVLAILLRLLSPHDPFK